MRLFAGLCAVVPFLLTACGDPTGDAATDEDASTGELEATSTGQDASTTEDPGDESSGSESTGTPEVPGCGDGVLEADELCDDGNTVDLDACNVDCEPSGELAWSAWLRGPVLAEEFRPRAIKADENQIIVVGTSWNGELTFFESFAPDGTEQWFVARETEEDNAVMNVYAVAMSDEDFVVYFGQNDGSTQTLHLGAFARADGSPRWEVDVSEARRPASLDWDGTRWIGYGFDQDENEVGDGSWVGAFDPNDGAFSDIAVLGSDTTLTALDASTDGTVAVAGSVDGPGFGDTVAYAWSFSGSDMGTPIETAGWIHEVALGPDGGMSVLVGDGTFSLSGGTGTYALTLERYGPDDALLGTTNLGRRGGEALQIDADGSIVTVVEMLSSSGYSEDPLEFRLAKFSSDGEEVWSHDFVSPPDADISYRDLALTQNDAVAALGGRWDGQHATFVEVYYR